MQIDALGYVGIQTTDLDQWATYGTRFLGMQLVGKSHGTLALRMDDRKQRVIVHAGEGEGVSFYGWEVTGGAALEGLAARLEKSGVNVVRASRALADERRVKDLIIFSDPIGNRLEAFHGAETALEPFKPGRSISGFRTGPLGMGHAVLTVERLDDVAPFYTDVLGFQLSDYILRPFKAYFFHVNPRHHSLAFIATGKNGIHHLMVAWSSSFIWTMSGRPTTWRCASRRRSVPPSAVTPTIRSPRSIRGRRRNFWSNTVGVAAASTRKAGPRTNASTGQACGGTTACG
jgi:2,3-dihydroxybiphenyl 1,2-dioxygenase